ncbi:MAG: hypothetical protein AAFN41_07570 [Planctomycetota bacterium]
MTRLLLALSIGLATSHAAAQQTINVPGDFAQLSDALNPAVSGIGDGDTVLVSFSSQLNALPIAITVPNITVRGTLPNAGARFVGVTNAGTFFVVTSAGAGLTLENMTLEGGNANGGSSGIDGGAINADNTDIAIIGCVFRDNTADDDGGAIQVTGGTATIIGSTFVNNRAEDDGGAIFFASATGIIHDCVFDGNSITPSTDLASDNGGAVNGTGSNVTVTDSSFVNNSTNLNGGGLYFNGSVTEVSGCTFVNNTAELGGGLLYLGGASGTLSDSTFDGNTSNDDGGGVAVFDSTIDIDRCRVINNRSFGWGGGVLFQGGGGGPVVVSNSLIAGNRASLFGGGVHVFNGNDLRVVGCTIVDNIAGVNGGGGGIRAFDLNQPVRVFNSIIRGNTPDQFPTNVTGIAFNCNIGDGELASETNIIDVDPLFVDAANGDYRLAAGSPSIDAGSTQDLAPSPNPVDADAMPRVVNGSETPTGLPVFGVYVDHGAFEFQPADATPDCPADQNFDGQLTPADFNAWVLNFNTGCG